MLFRTRAAGAALALVFLSLHAQAKAAAIAIPNRTPAQQAIQAEVIVVGKVAEIEKEMSKATPHPSAAEKIDYHVGVIKIEECISGAKGLTTIRVGWQPAPAPVVNPGGGIRPNIRPIRRFPQVTLSEGQEGCFFLTKHHDGDFYVMQQFAAPLEKKAADFAKQLETVKKIVGIFADPATSLKAKEQKDRQFAAAVLMQKYTTVVPGRNGAQPKRENIPSDQSKLIMQAIAEGEWNKFEQLDGIQIGAQPLFGMLRLAPGQDGFNPPKFMPGQQDYAKRYQEYVAKWVKDNVDTYRVQRWVVEK